MKILQMFIAVLVFSAAKSSAIKNTCEEGWNQIGWLNQNCFLHSSYHLSWDEAETQCTYFGGNLVNIDSYFVQNELEQLVSSSESTFDTWFGGYYYYGYLYGDDVSLLWRWSDMIRLVNFHNSESESDWDIWEWYSETHPGECLALQQSSGDWIYRNCSDELPFICRKWTDNNEDLDDNLEDLKDKLEILWWKYFSDCCAVVVFLGLVGVIVCFWEFLRWFSEEWRLF